MDLDPPPNDRRSKSAPEMRDNPADPDLREVPKRVEEGYVTLDTRAEMIPYRHWDNTRQWYEYGWWGLRCFSLPFEFLVSEGGLGLGRDRLQACTKTYTMVVNPNQLVTTTTCRESPLPPNQWALYAKFKVTFEGEALPILKDRHVSLCYEVSSPPTPIQI